MERTHFTPEALFAKAVTCLGTEAVRQAFVAARYEQAAGNEGVMMDNSDPDEGMPATAHIAIGRELCDFVVRGEGFSLPVAVAEGLLPLPDEDAK